MFYKVFSSQYRAFYEKMWKNMVQLEKQEMTTTKVYSFCLMVEASDHGYVLFTRRIHVTRYRIRYDMISDLLE
jgi:hypothetical protein